MVGGKCAAEDRKVRVAVADIEIAEHLVVGAILLDDEDHMLDALADRGHCLIRCSALFATTMQVAQNIGLPGAKARAAADEAMSAIRQRIKHVVFIIKENRTYDQVLGDLDIGNGDPHLAILGGALSPQPSPPGAPVRDAR